MKVIRLLLLTAVLSHLWSCSENPSIKGYAEMDDPDIYSRTYDRNGELIGINMMATSCPTTVSSGVSYICNVGSSGGEEFIYMETANTCDWALADTVSLQITGTPDGSDVGTCNLVFTRVDLTASFTTFSFTITISGTPSLIIADTSLNEDSPLTEIRTDADVQAATEGSGTYSFDHGATTAPRCFDNGILSIHENNGAIEFYPYPDFEGICNVKVNFDDGSIVSDSFAVTVNQVNDQPVTNFVCADKILQDQSLSVFPDFDDIDGDTLSWTAGPSHTCAWATVNPITGEITGTPTDDQVGVCDLAVVANDGTIDSVEVVKSIEVENIRPTLAIVDQTVNPAGGVFVIADALVQADEEGFGVYSISASAPGVACVDQGNTVVIDSSTGEITYTPNPDFEFICHVSVVFDDGNAVRNQVVANFSVTTLQAPQPVQNLMISTTAINSTSTSPTATWDDPPTFFDHFEIALGTSIGGDEVVTWTDIGYANTHVFSSLSLSECVPHYISVRVHDVAGNISSVETTSSFYADITPPSAPSSLILGSERFLPNGDANSTSWTASSDNCGLGYYEAGIGQTTSTDDVIAWTNIGLVTSYQFTGFTGVGFNRTDDYFNLVRAVDNAGNTSSISPAPSVAPGWMFPEFTYRRNITLSNPTPQNEFQVEVVLTPSNFDDSILQSDADDIRFYDNSDSLLEYHLVEFDEGEYLRFIVKIPTSGTNSFYMAYENPVSAYAGVESALNSSFIRDLYARISSNGDSPLSAYSYVDSNEIQINGATNYVLATRNSGVTTANSLTHTIVGARGPISARVTANNNDHDILPPISLAGVEFVNSYTRVTEQYEFYNPNSSAATIDIFDFTTAGAPIKNTTLSVPALSFLTTTYNTTVAIIESDIPVVSFTRGGNDAVQFMETSQDIFGIPSNIATVAFTVDGTIATVYWTDGTTETISGNRGQQVTLTASGNQMSGAGFRIIADNPIAGRQTADSDGSESTSFHNRDKLDRRYIIPTSSQYIAVICHEPGTTVTLTDGAFVDPQVCPATATHPGKIFFGNTGNSISFAAGTILESESSFFVAYENGTQQETNVFGPSSGIPYSENPLNPSVGAQINN